MPPGPGLSRSAHVMTAAVDLAKRWYFVFGHLSCQGYPNAKHFTSREEPCESIHDLSRLLARLEGEPRSCVIRARLREGVDPAEPHRRLLHDEGEELATLEDQARAWVCLDVDGLPMPPGLSIVAEPEAVVDAVIERCLPRELHDVTCCWQLSSSAGMPGAEQVVKAHLWFYLARPLDCAELTRWAKAAGLDGVVDLAVFRPVQVHYTARPIFDDGLEDPLPRRSGMLRRDHDVARLVPPPETARKASPAATKASTSRPDEDARDEAVALLRASWPGEGTGYHDATAALCGALLAAGWTTADVEAFVVAAAPPRARPRPTEIPELVKATAIAIAAGRPTTGWTRLAELVPAAAEARAVLGLEPADRPPPHRDEDQHVENEVDDDGNPVDPNPLGDGLPRSDLGNGERLLRAHGPDLLFSFEIDDWLVWNGQRWRIGDRGEVERRAADVTKKMLARALELPKKKRGPAISFALASEGVNKRRAMLESARCCVEVRSVDDLDADPMLLNTPSGTVDLRTGELRAHRREDRITKISGVPFDPAATAPTWEKFLKTIFAGDEDLIATVQRFYGYAITGDVAEEVIAVEWGAGANGKTTLNNAVSHVLGDYYRQVDTSILVETKNNGSKADIEKANLRGVRLAMCAETSQVRTIDDGLLKSITSNDRIVGKLLYQNTISFRPTHKPVLITNHRPVVKTTDEGTWRRIMLVPFRVTIPKAERDRDLGAKLRAEGPGILAWLVRGALAWQARGVDPCKAVLDETRDYRADQDALSDFIASRCVIDPACHVPATELYRAYGAWVKEATGGEAWSQTAFGEAMIERGYERRKVGTKRYIGIRLMTPLEAEAAKAEASRDTRDTWTAPQQSPSHACARRTPMGKGPTVPSVPSAPPEDVQEQEEGTL